MRTIRQPFLDEDRLPVPKRWVPAFHERRLPDAINETIRPHPNGTAKTLRCIELLLQERERQKKHIEHWKNRLVEMLESRLLESVLGGKEGESRLQRLAAAVAERKIDPFSAVSELLRGGGL